MLLLCHKNRELLLEILHDVLLARVLVANALLCTL